MIQAVLFDMDGVLTDTERLGAKMIAQACQLQGFELNAGEWTSLIGTTMKVTSDTLSANHPGADMPRLMEDWLQITLQTVRNSGVPVKEGAEEILPLLRGHGLKTGLCTNNTRTVVMEYLRLLGWTHRFDVIITAEDVKRRKPFPDTYLLAAQRLQVQPVNCIGVEDSPSGLLSVHAAHMHSVCIPDLIPIPDEIPTNATLSSLLLLPDYLHQRHQF